MLLYLKLQKTIHRDIVAISLTYKTLPLFWVIKFLKTSLKKLPLSMRLQKSFLKYGLERQCYRFKLIQGTALGLNVLRSIKGIDMYKKQLFKQLVSSLKPLKMCFKTAIFPIREKLLAKNYLYFFSESILKKLRKLKLKKFKLTFVLFNLNQNLNKKLIDYIFCQYIF